MQRVNPPAFADYEAGPNFDRARIGIATPFQYVDIALDSAASNKLFDGIAGDFLFVDASSTGVATMEMNNQYNDPAAPFQIAAGFGMQGLFKQLKLSWESQPGKKLRLLYSTGYRVVPTNIMQLSVSSATRADFSNTQKTVTNTAAQLVAANANRTYLLIQNNDASGIVYVAFGATATTANGVKIPPGGSYELNCNVTVSSVSAIGSISSNANVVVVEG